MQNIQLFIDLELGFLIPLLFSIYIGSLICIYFICYVYHVLSVSTAAFLYLRIKYKYIITNLNMLT